MESSLTRRCEACGYRYDSALEICPHDRRPLPPPDEAVAELGAYRLVERLADGGMGAVYRAVHRRLGRTVAIKLLQRDFCTDRGIINRFFHEARAANTIRHEHVVEVYDFVEAGEDVYFVMEHLRGEDLHEAIHSHGRGPMEPERAVAIVEQIASALHATHARDIIHRDLKPENVFLAERDGVTDFVKIFDFGVAKLDRPDGRSTIEGAVLGTPEYMAPEQARGGIIDHRADLYSLGCIAYEMLTRRQIFGGGARSEVLVRQLTFEPPSPRSIVPAIPAALDAAVLRALAKDPAARPQSALELAESMARGLGRGLIHAAAFRTSSGDSGRAGTPTREPSRSPRPDSLRPSPARSASPGGLVLRERRRSVWKPIALGAAAAVLVLGGFLTVKLRRGWTGGVEEATAAMPAPVRTPTLVTVLLQSVPSGAEILDEQGNAIGVTPHDLVLPSGDEREVRFRKPGFRAAVRRFVARGDTTIAIRLDPEEPVRAQPQHQGKGNGKTRSGEGPLDSMAGTIDPFAR